MKGATLWELLPKFEKPELPWPDWLGAPPGQMSASSEVPATVPSVTHGSLPYCGRYVAEIALLLGGRMTASGGIPWGAVPLTRSFPCAGGGSAGGGACSAARGGFR